jgi:DNA anti-recombination protein RmuC
VAVLGVLTLLAVVIAVAALVRTRQIGRRLDQIVESYWELRYEHGQLRAQLNHLQGKGDAPEPTSTTAFVPLSSIKRT